MGKFGISNYDRYWERRVAEKHYQFTNVHHKIIETAIEVLGKKKLEFLIAALGLGMYLKHSRSITKYTVFTLVLLWTLSTRDLMDRS